MDATIYRLYIATKTFVKRAKYLASEDYEPPFNESHVWANLWSVVEHAEDMLAEFSQEAQP